MNTRIIGAFVILFFASCNRNVNKFDASGTFEAEEVVVSAAASGKILLLNIAEGSTISKDSIVGLIDPTVEAPVQRDHVVTAVRVGQVCQASSFLNA